MWQICATIRLTNRDDVTLADRRLLPRDGVRSREVECLVDTGATAPTIPATFQESLGPGIVGRKLAVVATGDVVSCDLVGPD